MTEILIYGGLFLLGLCFGSFLNVIIYRFSEKENLKGILTGKSYCPNCKQPIRWYDNVPLLSYLILRGRCRHCGWKIPLRYPLVELLGGAVPVLVYYLFHDQGWAVVISYTIFLYLLIAISFVDWKTFEIPDELSIGGTILGLILSFIRPDLSPLESFLAALTGAAVVVAIIFLYLRLRGVFPLGVGDAKLLAMIGAFAGFEGIYCALLVGSVIALLVFVPQILKNRNLQFAVPFAPFLAVGGAAGLLCMKFGIFNF
jgi:leader peptidase (prepilin peptidase)/N-methyltransferase